MQKTAPTKTLVQGGVLLISGSQIFPYGLFLPMFISGHSETDVTGKKGAGTICRDVTSSPTDAQAANTPNCS